MEIQHYDRFNILHSSFFFFINSDEQLRYQSGIEWSPNTFDDIMKAAIHLEEVA